MLPSKKKYQTPSVARTHGKFGELLQGALPGENNNFLISMPIDSYATAKFSCHDADEKIIIYPEKKVKSTLLAFKIMAYFNLTCGWELHLESQLNEGKGLGSSTADLIATAKAISLATQKTLPMSVFLSFLREIEPSDGIMYETLACFYHRKVQLRNQFDFLPDLTIVGVDEEGVIDTIHFNHNLRPFTSAEKDNYHVLLSEMQTAIQKKDIKAIGKISTKSAILNQDINPKKNLNYFLEICSIIDALGIIVAHSGTYIGILLDKNNPNYFNQLYFLEKNMQDHSLSVEKFNTLAKTNSEVRMGYV